MLIFTIYLNFYNVINCYPFSINRTETIVSGNCQDKNTCCQQAADNNDIILMWCQEDKNYYCQVTEVKNNHSITNYVVSAICFVVVFSAIIYSIYDFRKRNQKYSYEKL